jgi:hypothetical protein
MLYGHVPDRGLAAGSMRACNVKHPAAGRGVAERIAAT